MDDVKNFAKVTVTDGNYDDTSTSIVLVTGDGAKLPAAPFNVVWWNATDYPDPADDPNVEIVRVTAISTDTLTITRAQEGTAAVEHNVAGKTYKMIACLTAKVLATDLIGDVLGTGPALIHDPAVPDIQLRYNTARFVLLNGSALELQSTRAYLGDIEGQGNSAVLDIDDTNMRAVFNNLDIATTQALAAVGPVGTVVGKLAIKDGSGTILGYLPIYNTIESSSPSASPSSSVSASPSAS